MKKWRKKKKKKGKISALSIVQLEMFQTNIDPVGSFKQLRGELKELKFNSQSEKFSKQFIMISYNSIWNIPQADLIEVKFTMRDFIWFNLRLSLWFPFKQINVHNRDNWWKIF